jgi:hypothetical protein
MSYATGRREGPAIAAWDDRYGPLASFGTVLLQEVGGWTDADLAAVHARAVEGHERALALHQSLPEGRTEGGRRKLARLRDSLSHRVGKIDAVRCILETERARRAAGASRG